MYKAEFEKTPKNFDAYLFWGEEPYFIEKYTQEMAQRIGKENAMQLYFDEYDFEIAKNYLSQSSLFGDVNLLIIKHDKALPKKELSQLIAICNKNANSFFIYALFSTDGKKIASLFDKKHNAVNVRFFKAALHEAKKELQEFCQQKNIEIDTYALEHLLIMLENNIELAKSELLKLSINERAIETKDIDNLVYPITPLNLEKLYIAIIKKEPIEELFAQIIEEEQNEMKILLGFENFMQQLFLFYSYIRLHGNLDSSQILGYRLPRHIEEQRAALAMRIKNYPKIFLAMQTCELELKTKTNIDKSALLLSYLIKIQGLF
ncbi:DNA polymerase III subunit delta [Nitratiruptor sp. YY08-26]|uniref:DNA polymerase III subunit delta n=1 Tax=unclassified Nitratiruptor TaxID=2624044 RepID=UPI001915D18C|nr:MULTISPECIES: DNA polymerase III subunit delta [unclassified Nitratiruptor]BCD61946.1 DNA polymerase III subunit delta [Nitratiruptor sp. YY08-13]BCD65881.1 DNA polymerase III subunit delta [Nitratiruptor sp. YY08-26]